MKPKNELLEKFEKTVNKQLLLHAAGKYIFCPVCSTVLDWTTVIIISVYNNDKSKNIGSQIVCTNCAKNMNSVNWEKIEHRFKHS